MGATTALLEREEQLATIGQALTHAREGRGALLVIEGEAGAGKTALLDAAGERAGETGMRVLGARGSEFERDFPYGVVRRLFEPLLAEPESCRLLEERGAGAARLFAPAEGAPPPATSEPGSAFAMLDGLRGYLTALTESGPLALLIDDAQWADLASLRAVAYIARRLADLPLALAVTVRSGEPGEHEALLDELRAEPIATRVEPTALSVEAVAALAADSTPGFAAAARRATGGNPFLLLELLRGIELAGDHAARETDAERLAELAGPGASRAIRARLARLGEPAVVVARAVALLEPHAEARRIARLCDLSLDEVASACERMVVASLLTDSRPVGFVHPLVRAAVLSELPEPRRAADHARAARLLSEDGAPTDAVAAHLLLGEPSGDPWAVQQLRAAGAEARQRGAAEAAVTYLRRALREPPPPETRLAVSRELGNALQHADDPEGIEVLRAVRDALDDPVERGLITAELCTSLALRRPGREGAELIEQSLAELADREAPAVRDLLQGQLVMQLTGGLERVPAGIEPGREHWPPGATGEERFLLRLLSYLHAVGYGTEADAVELADRAECDLDRYRQDVRAGLHALFVYIGRGLTDRGDQATAPTEVTMQVARERGAAPTFAFAHGVRAVCSYLDGDLDAAREDAERVLSFAVGFGLPVPLAVWVAVAVKVAIARGDLDEARRLLDEAWRDRDPVAGLPGAFLLVTRGELRAAMGRHAEARHDFIAARDRIAWLPYANPEVVGWRVGLALAEHALGAGEEARRLAAEAVDLARQAGGRRALGVTLRALGSVTPGEPGIELLREAAETLAGTRARLRYAEALVDLGAALRRAKRRKEARPPLREGLDLARECGAAALERRAREELAASGARPRRAALAGVDALTPSELRVARLAADGMTNRQIAKQLFVTPKTVETHLRHIYQKLEVAREGLGEVLGAAAAGAGEAET